MEIPEGNENLPPVLNVGDQFATIQEAKDAVKTLCDTSHVSFKVDTNNKTCLKFSCKNGGRKRDTKSKGVRVNLHYNQMGCSAGIVFYKLQKEGSLVCRRINNEHNHPISEANCTAVLTPPELLHFSSITSFSFIYPSLF